MDIATFIGWSLSLVLVFGITGVVGTLLYLLLNNGFTMGYIIGVANNQACDNECTYGGMLLGSGMVLGIIQILPHLIFIAVVVLIYRWNKR